MKQNRLVENQAADYFVKSLELTTEKVKQELEKTKTIEGFPIGDVEDILELSDPPYYTDYPNPYISEFIHAVGKPHDDNKDTYNQEPYVGDVSEGKNDPLYNAHSYHTKVPPKAIMKFIAHYTSPGDVVFDPFCGTGMTGVAASKLNRYSILCDLSPMATFIARSYNFTFPIESIIEAKRILEKIRRDFSWVYATKDSNGRNGTISYTVWSDIFICPFCKSEVNFYTAAFDIKQEKVKDAFHCLGCGADLGKRELEHAVSANGENKQVPVLISYTAGRRQTKEPGKEDLQVLEKINEYDIPFWHPTYKMMFRDAPWGDIYRAGYHKGIIRAHQFYTKRNLLVFSALWASTNDKNVKWLLTSVLHYISKKQSFTGGGGGMPGVLYIPSLIQEKNVFEVFERKIERIAKIVKDFPQKNYCMITTQSASDLRQIPSNSVDYIFTDPPFGSNIMYSEGSFLWESWLKVFTNTKPEAIMNNIQGKQLTEYKNLMLGAFQEAFRIIKPNRWITVEFHNSKASVWNAIRESLTKAGFVIAQVAILDKQQESFKQATSDGAVKYDLVINAYKPSEQFTNVFLRKAGLNLEKDFIKMHLARLPIGPNIERSQQMLYSKILSQYIQNGFEVRMDASEFYGMMRNNFAERDGYWFLSEQIPEYEKRLRQGKDFGAFSSGQTVLGIDSEKTAIVWLTRFLSKSKTYSEIYPEFSKNLLTSEDKIPELKSILEENFSTENGKYRLPSISEKKEKEEFRKRRLSREFQEILLMAQSGKKVVDIRKDALLYGLIELYNKKDVNQIRRIGKRLDSKVLESDDEIYAIIDWAMSKDD